MDSPVALDILVIEDDAHTRDNLRDILELDDHRVSTAGCAAEVLRRSDWTQLSAIILDRGLPDATAEQLMPRLKALAPYAEVIVVTGHSDIQGAIAALQHGATDYLLKPLNADLLRASLRRIAERRQLSLAKERSEATFRHLVEAAECMIVILRPDHTIVYFSPFAEQLTGFTAADVRGRDYVELLLPSDIRRAVSEEFVRVIAGNPTRGFPNPIVCRDGSLRWMAWNARFLTDYEGGPAILKIGLDITCLREVQERALQSERLAAIGQVVTGLAHESRNALQRSQACLEMLALAVSDRPKALDLIKRLQDAQDHLHTLYEDVRGFAAPINLEKKPCDLQEVWREAWAAPRADTPGKESASQRAGWRLRTCTARWIDFDWARYSATFSRTRSRRVAAPLSLTFEQPHVSSTAGRRSARWCMTMDRASAPSSEPRSSIRSSPPSPRGPD